MKRLFALILIVLGISVYLSPNIQDVYLEKQTRKSFEQFKSKQTENSLDELCGYIEIPSMDKIFPIYLEDSYENLSRGVALLNKSSLPIGVKNSNNVIIGHRGWKTGSFFKDIEKIRIGDLIYIITSTQKLVYRAENIKVINPNDIEKLQVQEGKDMITLCTCHPYLSRGKYRYLVYCVRNEEVNKKPEKLKETEKLEETMIESSTGIIEVEEIIRKLGGIIILGILLSICLKRKASR
ncbi:Sortase A, LPXTG specific [Lachnospiraceae bacterium TWA4]|nr:Sortase A, LPXTG specific [Lachnospiraceae bacterium TWA4]